MDLGLERYDPATLFEKLLTPATFMILAVMQLRVFQPHFLKLIAIDEYDVGEVQRYVRGIEERTTREHQLLVEGQHSVPLGEPTAQTPGEPLPSEQAVGPAPDGVGDCGTSQQDAPDENALDADENTKDKTVYIGQYTFTIESGARTSFSASDLRVYSIYS